MTDSPDARYWSGRRVLVTGAAGFIGSHVVEQLVRHGANVRAFVRYNSRNDYGWLDRLDSDTVLADVDVYRGDLTNPEAVSSAFADQDAVLHLGALIPIPYSYQHPREYVAANVEGAINVLEAARRSDIERLVHVSSSEVYGTAQTVPIDESHPLVPQSPYAATKVAADQLVLSFVRSFETPAVIARPFNTYGPRQTARAVIPTIIMQALQSGTVELGSTTPTRDFLYAADTAAGIMRCCATDGIVGETINLGTGVEWSVAEVVDLVGKIVGLELSVGTDENRIRPAGSEVDRLLADNRKAMELLDWQPTVPFVEGLERTVEWSRRWLKDYKPSVYNV